MNTIMKAFLLFAVAQLLSNGAFAACGGGGNHFHASPAVTESAPPAEVVELADERPMSVSVAPAAPGFNTASFDALRPALNLTIAQRNDLDDAKSDIRGQVEKLAKAHDKAQAKLQQCRGDCRSERANLDRATQALNSYNANDAFEARLSRILSGSQYRYYEDHTATKSRYR